jgi:hypothetical protein
MLFVSAAAVRAADLRVIDSRGTEVLVTGASVDYGSMLTSDSLADGIRLWQGDGLVTVKWAEIESLKFVKQDDSARPPRIEFEVALRNGKKLTAALFRQGRTKLLGKTDLGQYSIDLEKVRSISPVR